MALLNVNPTRMALLNLKKKVTSAKRGHKLLKDKQDGLMKHFMEVIKKARAVREDVEKELGAAFQDFLRANALMEPTALEGALLYPTARVSLEVRTRNVMSVRIPEFRVETEGDVITYGFLQTSGALDASLQKFLEVLPRLIELAQIEKSAEALAEELEKTRRRVNALEHKMIPDLEETVKFIKMKLGETERSGIINTMIMKAKMEAEEKAAA